MKSNLMPVHKRVLFWVYVFAFVVLIFDLFVWRYHV